jgi:hypothetical protein
LASEPEGSSYYYVVYYNDYTPAVGVDIATAKIADAYSSAYDPETGYTSVRWEVPSDISEGDLADELDNMVGWSYVAPYYLNDPPVED